jgi:hypothetical protein
VSAPRDLSTLEAFLNKHKMGVDQLFHLIHLGAQQVSISSEIPAPTRSHFQQIAQECYDLWHNTLPNGKRLL